MCICIEEIIIIFKLYVFKGLFEPFSVVYLFINILMQEKVYINVSQNVFFKGALFQTE